MAYHPEREAFNVPLTRGCGLRLRREARARAGRRWGRPERPPLRRPSRQPGAARRLRGDGQPPRRAAVAPAQPAAVRDGGPHHRGGLVFVGDIDRYMHAFHAWGRHGAVAHAHADGDRRLPSHRAVDGGQYVAVPSGRGWSVSWRNARIAFRETMQRPPGGPAPSRRSSRCLWTDGDDWRIGCHAVEPSRCRPRP